MRKLLVLTLLTGCEGLDPFADLNDECAGPPQFDLTGAWTLAGQGLSSDCPGDGEDGSETRIRIDDLRVVQEGSALKLAEDRAGASLAGTVGGACASASIDDGAFTHRFTIRQELAGYEGEFVSLGEGTCRIEGTFTLTVSP